MRQSPSALALLALLALACAAPAAAAVGPPGQAGTATVDSTTATVASPSDSRLVLAVHLQADGDARWIVSARYPLNSSSERAAFRSLAADYEAGRLEEGLSVDPFRAAVERVDPTVNRSMAIRGVNHTARVIEGPAGGNATGVLALRFTWTQFANATDSRLIVGDAFAGGWFGDLAADQTLLIYPPDGYTIQTVTPSTQFESGALQWTGPREFERGPRITLSEEPVPRLPLTPILVALAAALVLGGLLVYFWYAPRRESDEPDAGSPEPATENDGGADTGDEQPAAAGGEQSAASDATDDEELLSDEERVERLLERNDGRMKQAKIVEETRWSNAKVSQLLTSMAEEGRVEKLRIGRENLISLPDGEDGDAESE